MLKKRWVSRELTVMAIVTSLILIITSITFVSNANTTPPTTIKKQANDSVIIAQTANSQEFETVNSIARATTVFIGQNIENKQSLETKGADFSDAGSGVIIARQNSTYYVLTNQHVVPIRAKYGIRTHDGELHTVENSLPPFYKKNDQPDLTKDLVNRFGFFDSNRKVINGYDLALVKFDSKKEYPIAVIGNSNNLRPGESVFVSGWPLPKTISEDRIRVFKVGNLEKILTPNDPNGNYSLCYTAQTAVGMSGGPVFNVKGEVIGIHGAGQNSRPNCINTSLGIKINDFIQEQEKAENQKLINAFKLPPVNPSEFARIVTNRNADKLTAAEYQRFFDVSPDDPAFSAILSIGDKYGCMRPFDDGTFQPLRAESRGEFAVDINACLTNIEGYFQEKTRDLASKEDLAAIKKSIGSIAQEISTLKGM